MKIKILRKIWGRREENVMANNLFIRSFYPLFIKTGRAIKEEREITTLPSHCQNIKTTTAYEKIFVKTYDSNIR